MTTDDLARYAHELGHALAGVPAETYLLIAVPIALIALAVVARRSARPDRRVTLLGTVIGLGWSAQGMWDSAVHTYRVVPTLAAVLFFLFESFMVGSMLRAERFRTDLARRPRFVHAVWSTAVLMGTIVALAEGITQAPLRFSVPILVAYNWWLDLTADDDPADRLATSWRWTPRRLGLALGLLEPGERDAVTIDRDRLTTRITNLSFALHWGGRWSSTVLRRRIRLARLQLIADDGVVAETHARLARAERVMEPATPPPPSGPETHPTMPDQAVEPERVPTSEPTPAAEPKPRKPTGRGTVSARTVDGVTFSGNDLREHAIARLVASITPERPTGMSNAELAASYDPPLGERTAQGWGAEGRKRRTTNGHPTPEILRDLQTSAVD
jgi:hypothetical protein